MNTRKLKFLFMLTTILLLISSIIPTSIFAEIKAIEQAIPEGVYEADYMYLKDNTALESAANPFMQVAGSSGKIIVDADGKISFQHEMTKENAGYMPYIAIRQPGKPKAIIKDSTDGDSIVGMDGYEELKIVQDDKGTYTITYPIEDITKAPDVLMHAYMVNSPLLPSGFVYDNWYNVQIEINTSNLPSQSEVDKTALIDIIAKVQEFIDTYPYRQTTVPGVISVNEHTYTPSTINSKIASARNVADNPEATQIAVDAAYGDLETVLKDLNDTQFIDDGLYPFIVLDSLESDAKISEHASDFGEFAPALKQRGKSEIYTNIPFKNIGEDAEIRYSLPLKNGGLGSLLGRGKFINNDDQGFNYYQVKISITSVDLDTWQGFQHLEYDGKKVYLSFNVKQIEELKALLEEAKESYDETDDSATMITLKETITQAEIIADKLAATRPEIREASEALESALDDLFEQADTTALKELIDEAIEVLNTTNVQGTKFPNVISHGESTAYLTGLTETLEEAKAVFNNKHATQETVNSIQTELQKHLNHIKNQRYFTEATLPFIVIDSIGKDAKLSEHAELFGTEAETIKLVNRNDTYANIPIKGLKETDSVKYYTINSDGHFYTNSLSLSQSYIPQDETGYGYHQIPIRTRMVSDDIWRGFSHLQFERDGKKIEVYFSFNGELLDDLKLAVEDAKKSYNENNTSAEMTSLKEAIDHAEKTANFVAAARPDIRKASEAINVALVNLPTEEDSKGNEEQPNPNDSEEPNDNEEQPNPDDSEEPNDNEEQPNPNDSEEPNDNEEQPNPNDLEEPNDNEEQPNPNDSEEPNDNEEQPNPDDSEEPNDNEEQPNPNDSEEPNDNEEQPEPKEQAPYERATQLFPEAKGFTVNEEEQTVSVYLEQGNASASLKLSKEQVEIIKELGLTLQIIKSDVQLSIPASVFTDATEAVTIDIKELPQADNSQSKTFDFSINQGQIHNFEDGITLTFKVDPKKASNVNNLNVFYLNEETGNWENIGGTYNPDSETVSAVTNHFSTFSVFEVQDEPKEEVPMPNNDDDKNDHNGNEEPKDSNDNKPLNEDEQPKDNNKAQLDPVKPEVKQPGKALPNTATNYYNILLFGAVSLLLGLGLILFNKRKKA